MAKYTGSYESLIRGVSEQVPQDRYVGQHWAMDNMVADPVRGLARRQGSQMLSEKLATGVVATPATQQDLIGYKEYSFFIKGVEYAIFHRAGDQGNMPAGSTAKGVICINKDTGQVLDVVAPAGEAATITSRLSVGLSAITNIGKYICLAPAGSAPTYIQSDEVSVFKQWSAVWIKQGAYSRKYSIGVVMGGSGVWRADYTTPASYYPGVLSTSDIPSTATDYVAQVNNRVYAYQSAVNQWIGSAAAAIQPANIALNLAVNLNTVSGGVVGASQIGSHIVVGASGSTNILVDDGGDGSYAKAVGQEVESVNDLSPIHVTGKVVRIKPRQGTTDGVYYVKAVARDGIAGFSFKEVTWVEAAGIRVVPQFVFLCAQIIGNTMYIAESPTSLGVVSGDANVNTFVEAAAGDLDSSPIPGFFGKQINHMTNFQDRLMIVSGSTVFLSKSGDYFNWFRQSALTVQDDDPIEVYALGSEGDTITDSVMLDRSLILFGKQQQYAMDGRSALTPRNAYIATQSAHEDGNTCPPVVSGNFIFFAQQRNSRLTIQQMQTGNYADSFRAFDITTQLDGYLNGRPRQIVAMTSPSTLAVRVMGFTNGFYVFNYLDSADGSERLFDSWSRWYTVGELGVIIGLTGHNGNLLSLTLRDNNDGTSTYVLDRFYREASYGKKPYLDSWRPYTNSTGTIRPGWWGASACALAYTADAALSLSLVGDTLVNHASVAALGGGNANLNMGSLFPSYVEPTAPYVRDSKDKAILDGRLTLSGMKITVAQTSAFRAYLRSNSEAAPGALITDWIYRDAGTWTLNTQQVADSATVPVHILREIREFRLRLAARNWLPFTLSSIEWSGQFFTQRRR
jgi:hypothetical protein